MRGFASALHIPLRDLQSKLNLAQEVYQSMVDGTQAAADRPHLCIWALDFLDIMKVRTLLSPCTRVTIVLHDNYNGLIYQMAQDFSDSYENELGHQSVPTSIPPTVFEQEGTDSNGQNRKLIEWYRDLEMMRAENEDADACMGALANALQISPFELRKKLEFANDITKAVKSQSYELTGTPKGVRLSNWATAYESFLKEAQTCYLHYQLTNEGGGIVVPKHVFDDWVVDVYAVNNVSVNAHGDDATKTSNSVGLLHWYNELEFARLRADVDVVDDDDPFSDEKEQARMEELEAIAAMGAEHEQLLHALITRYCISYFRVESLQSVFIIAIGTIQRAKSWLDIRNSVICCAL